MKHPTKTRAQHPSVLSELSDVRKLFTRMLDPSWVTNEKFIGGLEHSSWVPTIDIKDQKNQYLIRVDLPGVDPKNIEVGIENGFLTLKGQKKSEKKEQLDDYIHVERSQGSFYRSISLPNAANATKIKATSKNGVLEIAVPKNKRTGSRKIKVKEE